MATGEQSTPSPDELAELSAFADGTLDPERREAARARIDASPELTELLARERHVVALLHEARARDRAPAALRARLEQAGERPRRRRAWPAGLNLRPTAGLRPRIALAGVAGLAALALALALVLPAGTPGSPTVSEAAALALRGPTAPAPSPDPGNPRGQLDQRVGEIYFPNWGRSLGWRAIGLRVDQLGQRHAITVFYAWLGRTLAYTILDLPALAQPGHAEVRRVRGVTLQSFVAGGRTIVTWRRAGHTCVLSATAVPAPVLEGLAAASGRH